jgi:5-methylcytosine-specific restriction enzyme subunit McrC
MSKSLKVFEHTTLSVGGAFKDVHFRRLVQYNERHGNQFFAVGYNRIHFRSYVGVIQVGNLTIEILPKADNLPETAGTKQKWQAALVEMIRQAGFIRLSTLSDARLRLHSASLLDIFFESFLAEVDQLTHRGLVRKYRQNRGNLNALKGRLVFQQHISRNLTHRERFFTEHVYYDRNNPFNRILKVALDVLQRTSSNPHLIASARRLSLSFQDVDDLLVSDDTFPRLAYTRNTERYRRAIQLARLIILNYSPDVRSGIEDVLAILFDMNTLFERYVYAQLKRAEGRRPESDIIFKAQTSRLFWKAEGMHKYIRPDIIAHIEKGPDRYRIVLDTKWKVPRDGKPSDSDLHQMHSYNLQFGAARSILVYPQISEKKNIQGAFSEARFVQSDKALSCGLMFVDLFESRGLRKDVGEQILSQIMTIL